MNKNIPDNVDSSTGNISETLSSTIQAEPVLTQKRLKRSQEDDVDKICKKFCTEKSIEQLPASTYPESTSINKTSSSKKDEDVDPEEFNNILNDLGDDIAKLMIAKINKLSRTNVKNILKHVITNEYVLSMVRNTMKIESGEKELEEAQFEPKLTRLKAKELMQNQFSGFLPVPSPMKKGDIMTQKLLEEEFPEESSDDEDYKPNEEEAHSDDDNLASPRTSELFSPYTYVSELSPSATVENVIEHYAEEDNSLVIELPFDLDPSSEISEADKIALRTRSKLKLTDTPLEEIEASFISPDITPDMYDTYIDDENWLKFLNSLTKGTDSKTEHPDEHDDEENDPDFIFQEEASDPCDLESDQVTRKERTLLEQELNALMTEAFQHEYFDVEDEEEDDLFFNGTKNKN